MTAQRKPTPAELRRRTPLGHETPVEPEVATARAAKPDHPLSQAANKAIAPLDRSAPRNGGANLPAVRQERTSLDRFLDEHAPAGDVVGRPAKFDGKEGIHLTTDDGVPISEVRTWLFHGDQSIGGFIKFNGEGEKPDTALGFLFDDTWVMPARHELGDLDESAWPISDFSGKAEDPWKWTLKLVFEDQESHELITWSTMSKTGLRAAGNLVRHYRRLVKDFPNDLPVIRLGLGGYDDPKFGHVKTPVFIVVGQASKNGAMKPEPSPSDVLAGDSIPF
jgi:hypothetical protein